MALRLLFSSAWWLCALGVTLSASTSARGVAQEIPGTYDGLTRPSRDVDLVLRVSGVLSQLPVAAGQQVKQGDVIAELNSEIERQSLEISRLKAESDHEIRLAETSKKLKETELNQLQELESKQAASKWEVETTRVEVELEQVRADTARFNKQLATLEYERQKLLLAERKLLAPFDGVILRTLKEPGEGVADLEPIAVLVRLNPLWIECNLPANLFGQVSVRGRAVVQVGEVSRDALVVAADPLVDIASNTFRVMVEAANGDGAMVAGVLATVRFPKDPPG